MSFLQHLFSFDDFAVPSRLWLALFSLLPFWRALTLPRLAWPTLAPSKKSPRGLVARLAFLPDLARAFAIVLLCVALAEPRAVGERVKISSRGVAVVVALDRSSSMTAKDADEIDSNHEAATRLEGAKLAFERFVVGRPDDAIGLVAFANYPDLICAPTLDHRHLIETVRALKVVPPGDDGTNLGHAIIKGLDALMNVSARRRVLILLTDGRDDPAVPRPIEPESAAKLAHDLGITLHAIALGSSSPGIDGADLARLERLAKIGDGQAFAAVDSRALADVFRSLDSLEKTTLSGTVKTRDKPRFEPFALAALGCLGLDILLRGGRWRRLP